MKKLLMTIILGIAVTFSNIYAGEEKILYSKSYSNGTIRMQEYDASIISNYKYIFYELKLSNFSDRPDMIIRLRYAEFNETFDEFHRLTYNYTAVEAYDYYLSQCAKGKFKRETNYYGNTGDKYFYVEDVNRGLADQ